MSPRPAKRPIDAAPGSLGRPEALAALFLGAAILASWLAIDPKSIDAFEAPKVVLVTTALAGAAVAAAAGRIRRNGIALRRPSLPQILFLAGLAGAAISAWASPRRAQALESFRGVALFLLAVPLGASVAFVRRQRALTAVFAAGAALNGLLVVLAAARLYSPIAVRGYSNRAGLGALVGNAGYAGIALALAAVTLVPHAARPGRGRPWAIAAGLLALAGMLATQSLSAIVVAASGLGMYAFLAGGRRSRLALAGGVALLLIAAAAYSPVRRRAAGFFRAAGRGEWNAAFTARAAPWLSAAEMIRAHPLLGNGTGTFRSEYVPARLAAEARGRRRLILRGMPTNSFAQAHNDYLDLLAAIGIPAGLCVIGAYALLLGGACRRARVDREIAPVAALLASGAVAAFTWFPFQIAPSALWLLLHAGRAHRLLRKDVP